MTPDQVDAPWVRDRLNFNMWMRHLDRIVGELGGLSVYDLPDCTFRDWFDGGIGPREAAEMALRDAGA